MAISARQSEGPKAPTVLINIYEVIHRTGSKRSTIYKYIKDGEFPKPIKIDRRSRWDEAEVQGWIDQYKARRIDDSQQWDMRQSQNPSVVAESKEAINPSIDDMASRTKDSQPPGTGAAQAIKILGGGPLMRLKLVQPQICFDPSSGALYLHIFDVETPISSETQEGKY